jgi:6-phosphogluconolactonase
MTPVTQFADSETLSQYAADQFVTLANDAVAQRGRFLVALSGGGTPQRLYELLAQPPCAAQIPWQQTHLLWGDERCVPPDAPGSNYRQIRETILAHIAVPESNVHRIKGELESAEATRDYIAQLATLAESERAWPHLDLALMGMGSDGHTASLFPGSDPADGATQPVLAVTAEYDNRPSRRVTLTQAVFNDAHSVMFLVTGANKATTLQRVLHGPDDLLTLPAQRIRPKNGTITWLIDTAAGREL